MAVSSYLGYWRHYQHVDQGVLVVEEFRLQGYVKAVPIRKGEPTNDGSPEFLSIAKLINEFVQTSS